MKLILRSVATEFEFDDEKARGGEVHEPLEEEHQPDVTTLPTSHLTVHQQNEMPIRFPNSELQTRPMNDEESMYCRNQITLQQSP